MLSFKFGTPLVKKDFVQSPKVTTKVHKELCLHTTAQESNRLKM